MIRWLLNISNAINDENKIFKFQIYLNKPTPQCKDQILSILNLQYGATIPQVGRWKAPANEGDRGATALRYRRM